MYVAPGYGFFRVIVTYKHVYINLVNIYILFPKIFFGGVYFFFFFRLDRHLSTESCNRQ